MREQYEEEREDKRRFQKRGHRFSITHLNSHGNFEFGRWEREAEERRRKVGCLSRMSSIMFGVKEYRLHLTNPCRARFAGVGARPYWGKLSPGKLSIPFDEEVSYSSENDSHLDAYKRRRDDSHSLW